MANVEFFKQQAKNLLKDYNTRVYNEDEGYYAYSPRFFNDIDEIVMNFDIDEDGSFTLMNAQHVIARLAGFNKWTELIKASEPILEIGKLLIVNRVAYQEEQGFFTNMVECLIVDDWKSYERTYLANCDDEAKLEAFKNVFLGEEGPNIDKADTIILNFSRSSIAQDMLSTIMREKDLPPDEAILSTINFRNYLRIEVEGWASIAISSWGHDDPYRKFDKLENPKVEIKVSKEQSYLIQMAMKREKASFTNAVLCFMIFELEKLGYHI